MDLQRMILSKRLIKHHLITNILSSLTLRVLDVVNPLKFNEEPFFTVFDHLDISVLVDDLTKLYGGEPL
jgi:hypothetical protein